MLKLLVMHQPRSRLIRLRNKWVEMDPRQWNAEMDVNISVGLGMGSKAEQITTAQSVLQTMEVIGQSPFASLINKETVYNAAKKLFTASGIKNIDDFLNSSRRRMSRATSSPIRHSQILIRRSSRRRCRSSR
jgi:hypothetical protein